MIYTDSERDELARIAYNKRAHVLDRIEALCDLIDDADDPGVRELFVQDIQRICRKERLSLRSK